MREVRTSEPKSGPTKRILWRVGWRLGLAVLAVGVAAGLRSALDSTFGNGIAFITFYPAVALVAMVAGGRAGLLATILSAIAADWLFIDRGYRLTGSETGDRIGLALFVTSGALISGIAGMLGRARQREWEAAERAKGAEELRRSEARYRLLFDRNPDGVFVVDMLGRFTEANAACETISGFSRDELLHKTFTELCAPDELPRTAEHFTRGLRERLYSQFETALIHKDGHRVELWIAGEPIVTGDQVVAVHCTAKDITQRKQAQEALGQSQQRLERAQEIAHLGSWELDLAQNRLTWSDEVFRIFGLKPQQFGATYEAFLDLVHPEDRAAVDGAYGGSLREGRSSYEIEHRVVRQDTGEVRTVHEKCEHFRDANGRMIRSVGMVHDITERKQAEQALRDSEARFRALVTGTGPMVFLASEAGLILDAPGWEALTGQPRAAYQGLGWLERIHPEDVGPLKKKWEACVAAGQAAHMDYRILARNGDWRWIHGYGVPVRGQDGSIIEWVGTLTDIHDRHIAQEALQESEELRRAVTDNSVDAIYVKDRQSRWLLANPALLKIVGQPLEAVLGKTDAEIYPDPAIGAAILANDARIMEQGEPETFEEKAETADGVRIFLSTKAPRRDAQGRVIGLIGISRDITISKLAEEALRQSEELFRVMFTQSSMGKAEADPVSGRLLRVNQALCRITGYSEEELLRHSFSEITHPQEREADLARLQALLRGDTEAYEVEKRYIRKDGSATWTHSTMNLTRDAAGKPLRLIALIQDINDRKRAEAVLARGKEELEQLVAVRTARLQELVGDLEHFSYTITHDMRAPLRAMQGFAELMTESCGACHEQEPKTFLNRIKAAAARMDNLITDSLNYSKTVRQELPLMPVDVGQLLRGMLDSYPEFQPSKAQIEMSADMPPVLGNEAGLTQCFSNLLNNAVKFVKPGQKPDIRIWAEPHDGRVRIWVEDQGIGIPKPMQARVFDMFSRGHQTYEGTGIGLALVRKVMDRMGGKVGVVSEEGKGSRFWLDLKRVDPKVFDK